MQVKVMTEALSCVQLSLRLIDDANAVADSSRGGGQGGAAAAAAALPVLVRRILRVFPVVAPAADGGAPERRALVAANVATCRLLSAAAEGNSIP
jgi:hypothetical protein